MVELRKKMMPSSILGSISEIQSHSHAHRVSSVAIQYLVRISASMELPINMRRTDMFEESTFKASNRWHLNCRSLNWKDM
jgi:hypothetical protein